MRIPELFAKGGPVFSFEFFLPKREEDMPAFRDTVRELKALQPGFVTLTYGAGGSARERTIEAAGAIKGELGVETAAHLTCIAHTRGELTEILRRVRAKGIENIVALRGDAPKDGSGLPPERREVPYASDLVRLVRGEGGFAVAVAGYPEKHPEAPSAEADLARLKEKVDAGGDWVITQLFFDEADYFSFVSRARAAGVRCPIVPGIMPVTGWAQTKRFTQMCGARLPAALTAALAPVAEDKEAVTRVGIEWATRQCRALLAGGAPGVHFYTLNRSHSTAEVLARLRRG
ncbi:MAG: methylenetetrahydrofolate reductase [NAD(P)H] [Elusimicrobia bacterium]|nr:methylenetetrahydrofolate reductase [NAD(P)H] [Elusimicrobiota bacterium]